MYALGIDAYRLIPLITNGGRGQQLEGMTGTLYLDDRNRVLRDLPWARIQRGKPWLMDRLAESERLSDRSRNKDRQTEDRLSDGRRAPYAWQNTARKAAAPNN